MIEGATKRTWVQGGVGVAANGRGASAGAASSARGDGFGDSIASALERLLSRASGSPPTKLGTDPLLGPMVVDDGREEEPLSDATAADLASFDLASFDAAQSDPSSRDQASSTWATSGLATSGLATSGLATSGLATSGLATSGLASWAESASDAAPARVGRDRALSQAPIDLGGMAVWEGTPWDGEPTDGTHSPFSERPTTSATAVDPRELPTLAPDPWADVDDPPVPLVTKRQPRDVAALRASPTEIEELVPTRAARRGVVAAPTLEVRSARTTAHGHAVLGESAPRPEASDGWGRAARTEGRRGSGKRADEDSPPDGAASRVHTRPLVTIGARDAGPATGPATMAGPAMTAAPSLDPWREAAPLDQAPGEQTPRGAGDDATPYHVARLGDHRARVELMHPELGRVEVEVTTVESRVDVELLARSLGASIALRSSEEELRGELRQRGASLRNYRVRTASAAAAAARAEEEEWR